MVGVCGHPDLYGAVISRTSCKKSSSFWSWQRSFLVGHKLCCCMKASGLFEPKHRAVSDSLQFVGAGLLGSTWMCGTRTRGGAGRSPQNYGAHSIVRVI